MKASLITTNASSTDLPRPLPANSPKNLLAIDTTPKNFTSDSGLSSSLLTTGIQNVETASRRRKRRRGRRGKGAKGKRSRGKGSSSPPAPAPSPLSKVKKGKGDWALRRRVAITRPEDKFQMLFGSSLDDNCTVCDEIKKEVQRQAKTQVTEIMEERV